MTFKKYAQARVIGASPWNASDGTLRATTSAHSNVRTASYFLDGSRVIDFEAMLKKYAATYKISRDPRDYLLEAIRANTAEAPNENDDCFTRAELLNFRPDLGMPVYATYTGKPHHVNHNSDDPTRARGIIVDAHYNRDTAPLADCPQCKRKTAERENRDATGCFCKCGYLVKDEFPEILLAVDVKKDPVFARGVRDRVLTAGSMGCTCLATECNVCGNIAYNERQFCAHLKPGLKGTIWVRNASGNWVRSNVNDVRKTAKDRGIDFKPVDFCYLDIEDFQARKAFEKCRDVEFDEYSRVGTPADPKALSREILKAASKANVATLSDETEALIRMATVKKTSFSHKKIAKKFYIVRVDGDPLDTAAAESVEKALDLAAPDAGSTLEIGEVDAMDAGAARLMKPASWSPLPNPADGLDIEADVRVQAPPGEQVIVEPSDESGDGTAPGAPGAPGIPGAGEPGGIEQYTQNKMDQPMNGPGGAGDQMSPNELGILPPGAAKQGSAATSFEAAYNDYFVEADTLGLSVLNAKEEPVLFIPQKFASKEAALSMCTEVMGTLMNEGLVSVVEKHAAKATSKTAQVLDDAINDMADYKDRSMYDQVTDGAEGSMLMDQKAKKPTDSTLADGVTDMTEKRDQRIDSTLEGGTADHDREEQKPGSMKVTDDALSTSKEKPKTPPKSTLEGGTVDFAVRGASLGSKWAHADKPEEAWTVVAAAYGNAGPEITIARDEAKRKLATADLAYWRPLDATPESAVAAFEGEMKLAYQAKVAEIRAEADKLVQDARVGALDALERATNIVNKRFSAGLEDLPIRDAIEATLKTARILGVDPSTGESLNYDGMSDQLAQFLTAEVIEMAHADHVDAMFSRSAELMARSEEYLADAEREVANLRVAMPTLTKEALGLDNDEDERIAQYVAEDKRRQASLGNFIPVTPDSENMEWSDADDDARLALRGALGATRVASRLSLLAGSR